VRDIGTSESLVQVRDTLLRGVSETPH